MHFPALDEFPLCIWDSDGLIVLFTFAVMGHKSYFDFGFSTLNENCAILVFHILISLVVYLKRPKNKPNSSWIGSKRRTILSLKEYKLLSLSHTIQLLVVSGRAPFKL